MQKARRHVITTLRPLVADGFRVYFTPLLGVLFTFPSRYWFAIGLSGVFSLTGWAPLFHARFLVPRATQDTTRLRKGVMYRAFTVYGRLFQVVPFPFLLATSWSYNPRVA